MSGFDDDFGELVEPTVQEVPDEVPSLMQVEGEEDPAAEFLSREQEQLGDIDKELEAALTVNRIPAVGTSPPPLATTPERRPAKEEPPVLRQWRENQMQRLKEKDAQEEADKENLKKKAAQELAEWYRIHDDSLEKLRSTNRAARQHADRNFVSEIAALEPGTEWERVAKLCDFNPKSSKNVKDISRMRSIILQLKQQAA